MNKQIKYNIMLSFLSFFVFLISVDTALAQASFPNTYHSEIDKLLSLKVITLAPAYDNVEGVYKTSADKKLDELITQDSFWSLSEFKPLDASDVKQFRADWFTEKTDYAQKVIINSSADGLIFPVITKGPSGLTVTLNLYLKDGSLLLSVSQQDESAFEITKLNEIVSQLYKNLKQKLPYQGMIISRTGNKVTINLGKKHGVKENSKLSVAQIISIKRHPKLKFMTGTEKEITGQVIVNKVDTDLSFAQISFEKEFGVIEKGSKVLPVNHVEYTSGDGSLGPILEIDQSAVEWVPTPEPQYGKVSAAIGISDYKIGAINKAGTSSYSSSKNMIPSLKLGIELWITSEWFGSLEMKQSFFKTTNGLSGSSPDTLSFVNSKYDFIYGYKYSMTGNFWGPQLSVGAGFVANNTRVTDSTPVAYTSTESNGIQLQVGGYFPTTPDYKTAIGAKAKFVLFSNYSETPVSSGKANASINAMSLYLTHQISTRVQIRPEIDYSMINASFSGTGSNTNGVRSMEEKNISYMFGIEYLF